MKSRHETIKFFALALAFFLILGIFNGALSILSFFIPVFSSYKTDDYKHYEIQNDIQTLDLDIHLANLEIDISPNASFQIETNYKHLKVEEKGDKLVIKDKKDFRPNAFSGAVVKLYFPEDCIFNDAVIQTGAGRNDLKNLQAKRLDIRFGVGESYLENVNALEKASLEGGAGALTISDSRFQNLDLELGVGQFDFSGLLLGQNKLEMGVGSSQIELLGTFKDYRLNIKKRIG